MTFSIFFLKTLRPEDAMDQSKPIVEVSSAAEKKSDMKASLAVTLDWYVSCVHTSVACSVSLRPCVWQAQSQQLFWLAFPIMSSYILTTRNRCIKTQLTKPGMLFLGTRDSYVLCDQNEAIVFIWGFVCRVFQVTRTKRNKNLSIATKLTEQISPPQTNEEKNDETRAAGCKNKNRSVPFPNESNSCIKYSLSIHWLCAWYVPVFYQSKRIGNRSTCRMPRMNVSKGANKNSGKMEKMTS